MSSKAGFREGHIFLSVGSNPIVAHPFLFIFFIYNFVNSVFFFSLIIYLSFFSLSIILFSKIDIQQLHILTYMYSVNFI